MTVTDISTASGLPASDASRGTRPRVRFGRVWVDSLTFSEALTAVRALVEAGLGGSIFTPNVDHVIIAEDEPAFRRAYRRASLSLADGIPLVWASQLLRPPLPAKLSGSDMIIPLARLAAAQGWGVYLLGGMPGAATATAALLEAEHGVRIVGIDDTRLTLDMRSTANRAAIARIRAARPALLFVALGAPKQELWIAGAKADLGPVVSMGVGASLDFIAGMSKRAPGWMSSMGLEWVHRLLQDPRRLWRRYLIRGPRFIGILWRTAQRPRAHRVRMVPLEHVVEPAPTTGEHHAARAVQSEVAVHPPLGDNRGVGGREQRILLSDGG